MNIRKSIALALALAVVGPGIASASTLVLDTGTPPLDSSGNPTTSLAVLNTADWYAAEVYLSAGETVTQLSAYMYQGVGGPSGSFTWDIYSSANFTANSHISPLYSDTSGVFNTSNAWNATAVNWTPTTSGYYWVALQVSSTSQTRGIDLPLESSATSGNLPATAFAFAGTNHQYNLSSNGFGIEVSAVPLPAAVWLLGSGLMGLGLFGRRRRVQPAA